MNKKLILTVCVLIFCSLLFIFARGLQQKYLVENSNIEAGSKGDSPKEASTPKISSSSEINNESSSSVINKDVSTSNTTVASKSASDNKIVSNNSVNTITSPKPSAEPPKIQTQKPNFLVTDTITNKVIFSTNIEFKDEDAGRVTIRALDAAGIRYKAGGIGSSIYFSMIADLKERSQGPASGWCYLINGVKPGVSAGSYKLSKDDTLEWRFLKDGL